MEGDTGQSQGIFNTKTIWGTKYRLILIFYVVACGWKDNTKLREKAILKFINMTLRIAPTAVTYKLMKLGR